MNFRTEIKITESPIKIEHNQKLLTIGSCFAENISEYFKYYLFNIFENPFGVLYNQASIYNAIKITAEEKGFVKDDLVYDQGEWHSFYHHSDFSHHNPDECLTLINTRSKEVKGFLGKTDWVIISLGTSFIYKHKEKDIIVSNCHKIPANKFEKILLSVEETEKYLTLIIDLLKKANPTVKIIFTVSPIRHIKDGFAENQLSKSSLIVAVNNIVKSEGNCLYFPSYEIMMDDLREYRFYEKDLLHPNKIAIEYIWEKFSGAFFSKECEEAIINIGPYARGIVHRPRNVDSPGYKAFQESMRKTKKELLLKYPYLAIE